MKLTRENFAYSLKDFHYLYFKQKVISQGINNYLNKVCSLILLRLSTFNPTFCKCTVPTKHDKLKEMSLCLPAKSWAPKPSPRFSGYPSPSPLTADQVWWTYTQHFHPADSYTNNPLYRQPCPPSQPLKFLYPPPRAILCGLSVFNHILTRILVHFVCFAGHKSTRRPIILNSRLPLHLVREEGDSQPR